MNPVAIVKGIVGLVASAGAGTVVGNAIKATTPAQLTTINKVLVGVGGVVLSGAVGDIVVKYTSKQIEEITDAWKMGIEIGESLEK